MLRFQLHPNREGSYPKPIILRFLFNKYSKQPSGVKYELLDTEFTYHKASILSVERGSSKPEPKDIRMWYSSWKEANIITTDKKESNLVIDNYRLWIITSNHDKLLGSIILNNVQTLMDKSPPDSIHGFWININRGKESAVC